jgi:exodeoxyribonuclease-3
MIFIWCILTLAGSKSGTMMGQDKQARIISWNVNGIRAVQGKGFLDWLKDESPDILCVQETKAHPEQLDQSVLAPAGYHTFWASAQKRGYSGLATFTKEAPESVENLGIEDFDCEGRVQVITYPSFVLLNTYFPNSQEKGRRIDYKLGFCSAILELCERLRKNGQALVLCGDYNIAHKPIDLKNPDSNTGNPGFLPEEREWMEEFLNTGYIDSFRHFCPDPDNYTWWSYRTRARERNAGWRIDYHCVNEEMAPRLKAASILSHVMGSDHCPVDVTIEV